MPMTFGHVKPDMRLSKAEREADKAVWKELADENAKLREVMRRAAEIIDRNLYRQREKVEDASALLKQALSADY